MWHVCLAFMLAGDDGATENNEGHAPGRRVTDQFSDSYHSKSKKLSRHCESLECGVVTRA